MNWSLHRRWILAGAAVAVVGAIVAFGADDGNPATDMKVLPGMAWLTSANVGQLTLLDGSTAEVVAQIAVASAGNALDVVQSGTTAYAVDRTAGTVRRIDAATFEPTRPVAPIANAQAGLTAFAGPHVLYVMDGQRGVYVNADPKTASPLGEPNALAAQLDDGTAGLDDVGRLWLVDNGTGDLTSVDHSRRTTTHGVVRPGHNTLAIANGSPVIVNAAEHKVIMVDPDTGGVARAIDLDLRSTDTVQVSGSPHAPRAYVVASRGVLNVCDLDAGSCDRTIPLGAEGQLGAAVEAANRIFVPDYSTGQIWIVDLTTGAVVAKPVVLRPAGRFQLRAQDDMVFFNDPKTERAGVVHFDGNIVNAAKYDPTNPSKGLTTPLNHSNGPAPAPEQQSSAVPSTSALPPGPQNPQTSPNPQGSQSQTSRGSTTQSSLSSTTSSSSQAPVPSLVVSASTAAPVAGDQVTFNVKAADNSTLTNVTWTFNGNGGDAGNGAGTPISHTWATDGGPFLITVHATVPDGRSTVGSTQVTVAKTPTINVTLQVSAGGTVSGGPFGSCAGTCTQAVDRRHDITLKATPDNAHTFDKFSVAECGQPGVTTCVLRMASHAADLTIPVTFKVKPLPTTTPQPTTPMPTPTGTATGTTPPGTSPPGLRMRGGAIDGADAADPRHAAQTQAAPGTCDGDTSETCESPAHRWGFVWILLAAGLGLLAVIRRGRRRKLTRG
ncbi:hypothetical protein [Actinocrispum wychmicini]|uniref:hypothetical protein n=1 Tax=Actinocrispum wychmicini TaxID=1213861 RepID=UPI00104C77AA|nr:hypothetical protein [Actinocrispum wychmicini]